jgi:Holliday junction resolvasome RuvABC endonuclease subunit
VNELENKESILSSHGVTNEEELSNRINEIFEKLEESNLDEDDYDNIKRRMNELEDYMEEWMMTAQAHIEAFETVFREEFNIRLEEYLKREETNLKGGGISKNQKEKERNKKEDTNFKLLDEEQN